MANIRISSLPNEATPSATDEIAIDGITTRKTTLENAVKAGRPVASQPEAEAGVDNLKAMTPLTTKQAIDAIGGAQFATTAQGSKANTALQLANIGTTVQAHDALLDSVSGLSLTAGDLFVADGPASVTTLGKGAEGQVLGVVGGNLAYKSVPAVDLPSPPVANTVPVRKSDNSAYEAKPVGTTGLAVLGAETPDDVRSEIGEYSSVSDAQGTSLASAPDYIRTAGYTSAGDGGGALYKKVASEPSHAGKFSITLSDSVTVVWYELAETRVTPKMFGATGDGVTDDTSAIEDAFGYTGSVDLDVFYKVTSTVTVSSKPISVRCPRGKAFGGIVADVASGNVLVHEPTAGDHFFELRDFTMKCNRAPVAGQWAIHIDGSSQVTAEPYNDKFLTGEREKRRGVVDNIDFLPVTPASHGFGNGLRITSLLNFAMTNLTYYGQNGTFSGEAYAIDGDGVPVDMRANDLYAYNVDIGLNMPDYVEAVYVRETEFVNVNHGVVSGRHQPGRSVLAATAVGSSGLRIGPSHVAARYYGFDIRKAPFHSISRCLVVLLDVAEVNVYGFNVEEANLADIRDNTVNNTNVSATNCYGIVAGDFTNGSICGNRGQGTFSAVLLVTSDGNNVKDNQAHAGASYAVSIGAGCTDNIFDGNMGGSVSVYEVGDEGNSFVPLTYNSRVSFTLTGGSPGENVDIAVPAGVFPAAPETAFMQTTDGGWIYGEYVPGGSTATSLRFTCRNFAGTALAGGSYGALVNAEHPWP